MTKEEIYRKIMDKHEEGENPLEYNESAMPNKLIFIGWLNGKGFITVKEANKVLEQISENEINEFFEVTNYIIEDLKNPAEFVYRFLSDFIASIEVYAKRFEREFE